jgi:hypothetical protein
MQSVEAEVQRVLTTYCNEVRTTFVVFAGRGLTVILEGHHPFMSSHRRS